MQFQTQRLTIRPWQPNNDARHAMDIFGDARVMAWLDEDSRDTSIRQAQGRLQRYLKHSICGRANLGSWAVEQKDIGRVIGHIMLAPLPDIKVTRTQRSPARESTADKEGTPTDYFEIQWSFRPSSWGYGYASESATPLLQYAFETLNLPMVLAIAQPENKRAIALMERVGMQCDGLTARYYGGQPLLLYLSARETSSRAIQTAQPNLSARALSE